MKQKPVLNPGSADAVKNGCTCPILDNCHGKGVLVNGKLLFWENEDCKIHGRKKMNGNKKTRARNL